MSLYTLPKSNYHYLCITKPAGQFIWNRGLKGEDNAQYWLDQELNSSQYEIANAMKFWKSKIKVTICAFSKDDIDHTTTIYLHNKK